MKNISNNPADQEKFSALLENAKTREQEGDTYQDLANHAYRQAANSEAEAAEMLVPFKRGDVIEYSQPEGWYLGTPKTVTRRMLVRNLEINYTYQGVTVHGQAWTKKIEPSRNSASVVFGVKAKAQFLRILKKGS